MSDAVKELYRLRGMVEAAVHENFGYSPNTDNYNTLESNWRDKEFEVKTLYPEEYKEYDNKFYY